MKTLLENSLKGPELVSYVPMSCHSAKVKCFAVCYTKTTPVYDDAMVLVSAVHHLHFVYEYLVFCGDTENLIKKKLSKTWLAVTICYLEFILLSAWLVTFCKHVSVISHLISTYLYSV